jgi:hypothetical protein
MSGRRLWLLGIYAAIVTICGIGALLLKITATP